MTECVLASGQIGGEISENLFTPDQHIKTPNLNFGNNTKLDFNSIWLGTFNTTTEIIRIQQQ